MLRGWTALRVASVLAVSVAMMVINTLPAITAVLAQDLGFAPRILGVFASAHYSGLIAGILSAFPVMRRASPRATARAGLLLLLAVNLVSVAAGHAFWLIALSAAGGFGAGLTTSACTYVFSLEDRERNSAASFLGQTGLAAIVITVIPAIAHPLGWRAVFAGLALLEVPCLLLVRHFPAHYQEEDFPDASTVPAVPKGIVWVGLSSVALCGVAIIATWTYLERMGAIAGISESTIANSLSACTFFGFLSSILVLYLGERITGMVPLILFVAIDIGGLLGLGSSNPWIYSTAMSAFYFALPPFISVQFGALMRRMGVATKKFAVQFTLASYAGAVGPVIGGVIAEHYGYGAVRSFSIALTLVSAVLLWAGFMRQSVVRIPAIGNA